MTEQAIPASAAISSPEIDFDYRKIRQDMLVRRIGKIAFYLNAVISYFFLWVPIIVLVVFSFNNSSSISSWGGFGTQWYNSILSGVEDSFTKGMLNDLRNTLFVAVIATI